jgi:hypothetical protein
MVAVSISQKGEMIGNVPQGVGEVHSTDDMKDGITLTEGRCLAVCKSDPNRGGLSSSIETQRGIRI